MLCYVKRPRQVCVMIYYYQLIPLTTLGDAVDVTRRLLCHVHDNHVWLDTMSRHLETVWWHIIFVLFSYFFYAEIDLSHVPDKHLWHYNMSVSSPLYPHMTQIMSMSSLWWPRVTLHYVSSPWWCMSLCYICIISLTTKVMLHYSGSSPWQPRMKLYYVSSCLWQWRKLYAMCAYFSNNPVWCSIMGGLLTIMCDAVSVCAIWSTRYDATVCLWPAHVMLYRGCIISWITVFICRNSTTD